MFTPFALTAGPTPEDAAEFVRLRLRKVKPRPFEVPKLSEPVAPFEVMTTELSDTADAVGPARVTVCVPMIVTALYVPARIDTEGMPEIWA
jgi:hypothetical protein